MTMNKIVAVLVVAGAMLCMTNPIALAQSFTTGFTFTLPETFPLHNVYVGARQDATGFEDVLLPGNPTLDASGITPAGFDVPVGDSAFNLNSLFDFPVDSWAVVGLFTDAGVDHVVMATNADLTGVPLEPPLIPLSFDEDLMITSLTTGMGLIAEGGIVETLGDNEFMSPFDETAQLFFFSDGQPIPGSSVTANAFGVAIPEPSTVLLLGAGFLGLLGYGWWQRGQRQRGRSHACSAQGLL
jgi:PEP-CTERM motif